MKAEKKSSSQAELKAKQKKRRLEEEDEQGGAGTAIEFHDFLSGRSSEERALSPEEQKRIILTHMAAQATHVENAKKQKEQMSQFKNQAEYDKNQRASAGEFPPHPRIHNAAQFSGQDKKVNYDTSLSQTQDDTNPGQKQELQNRYEHKHRLTQGAKPQHSYTPKYKPPGT